MTTKAEDTWEFGYWIGYSPNGSYSDNPYEEDTPACQNWDDGFQRGVLDRRKERFSTNEERYE